MLSFPTYAEFLLQSVDGASLEGDVKRMADIEARIQEKERKEAESQLKAQQVMEDRDRINSLLSEAGKLISEEKFEAARQKLGELFRMADIEAKIQEKERRDESISGTFSDPQGFDFDEHGNLFVVDSGNKRIVVFDPNLKFKVQLVHPELYHTRFLMFDGNGDIVVTGYQEDYTLPAAKSGLTRFINPFK